MELVPAQRREIRKKVERRLSTLDFSRTTLPYDEVLERAYMLAKYTTENPTATKPDAQQFDSTIFNKVFGTIKTLRYIAGICAKERKLYKTQEEKNRAYLSMLIFVHEHPEYANSSWFPTTEYYGLFTHSENLRGNYEKLRKDAQAQILPELKPKTKKTFRVTREDNQRLLQFLWLTRKSDEQRGLTYQQCIDAGFGAELRRFYNNNLTNAFNQAKQFYTPKPAGPLESLISQPQTLSPLPKSP